MVDKVVRRWVYEYGAQTGALRPGNTMGDRTKGAWPPTDFLNTFLFGHRSAQRLHRRSPLYALSALDDAGLRRMQDPAPATAKFQLALPYILGPVSQGLAALHASRARKLHPSDPTLRTTHCPACGADYIDGGGEYRSVRHNGKRGRVHREAKTQPKRCLQMSCGVCGHREELPIEHDSTPSSLQLRKKRRLVASTADIAIHSSTPAMATKSGEAAHAPAEHKPQAAGRRVVDIHRQQPSPSLAKLSLTPPADSEARKGGNPTPTLSLPPARSKARPKSSGLQGLLARNREKQEQEKKTAGNLSGLSAFLQDLG